MFLLNKLAISLSIYKVTTVPKVMHGAIILFLLYITPLPTISEKLVHRNILAFFQYERRSHFLKLSNYLFHLSAYFIKQL